MRHQAVLIRANGGIETWMEMGRRGARQLAVTGTSRKQAELYADVQLALGQFTILLPIPYPLHLPLTPRTPV